MTQSKAGRASLRHLFTASLLVLVLILGAGAGIVLDRRMLVVEAETSPQATGAGPDFGLMQEAWNIIHQHYADPSAERPRQLTYAAIGAMVDALGDTGHSRFLTPQMVQEEHDLIRGSFEGIGAELQMQDGHVVIAAPLDGSPAEKAGLRPGDVILRVDGQDVTGLPLDQVVGHILGPAGTPVTLTVQAPAAGTVRDVTLVRARITIHTVTWAIVPGTTVADVRIAAFSQGVADDLKKALISIEQQGVRGIILDLRNNPGGLLGGAVGTASQFLTGGDVLLERDAQGRITPIQVLRGGVAPDLPVVALVNSGTASAAEIVAGAFQDAHRAVLVGEKTFGTGTVLREFRLSDGSALLLAVEEWLTRDGRIIWHKGITPDLTASLPANTIPLRPAVIRRMTPAQVLASQDTQFLRALGVLAQPPGRP